MDDKDKLALLDGLFMAETLANRREGVDPAEVDAAAKRVCANIAAAKAALGKRRMAEAKAAVGAARGRLSVVSSGPGRGAGELKRLRARDVALDEKLTMAARNQGADAEADEAGMEEDLSDLKDWEDREGER